jgi:hypothetical protein
MAPAQLITRTTEQLKDRNFYKPVKYCGSGGVPETALLIQQKNPHPVKGEGSIMIRR